MQKMCTYFFYVQASFWSSVNRYAKINPSFLLRIRLKNSSDCSHVGSLFTNEQRVPALPMFPLPMNSMFPLYHCSLYQWTAGSLFPIVPTLPMNSQFTLYHCSLFTNEQQVPSLLLFLSLPTNNRFPLYQWTACSLFKIVPSLPVNSRFTLYHCSLFTDEQQVPSLPGNSRFPLSQWTAGLFFTSEQQVCFFYQWTVGSLFTSEQQVYSLPVNSKFICYQ